MVLSIALTATLAVPARIRAGGAPAADGEAPLRRLTAGPTINAMPHWSPDGRHVLFHSRRPVEERGGIARRRLWVIDADGGEARAVSQGPADEYHGRFSPVGESIVFVSEANGTRDLWLMPALDAVPVPLTDDAGLEEHPAWSPDGERIVYTAFPKEGGSFDLWVINRDGSGKRRLTFTAANEIFPAWHPDGETIAYVTDAGGSFDLYALRLRNETTYPLVTGPDHEVRPAWSPDGTKLAFARWPARGDAEHSGLWIANADGSVPVELEVPRGTTHPAWAPDGRRLAFQQRTATGWDILTYEPPAALTRPGHLHPSLQTGAGATDTVLLRDGERLTGRVENPRYVLHTAYATLEFPRQRVATLRFHAEGGLTRLVLINGDTVSGVLPDDSIRLVSATGARRLGSEVLDTVTLRPADDAPVATPGPRFVMENGDVLTVAAARAPLRIRVSDQTVSVPVDRIVHATIAAGGTRAEVELDGGERTSGDLESSEVALDLATGPSIRVRPGQVRSILRGGPAGGREGSAP
jgi:TolB protein